MAEVERRADPTGAPEVGLRERKRLATRRAIQVAAIETVERLGLTGATVEAISKSADVAPRTFFNHFPTKESALRGEEWRALESAHIDRFVASRAPIMEDLGRLLSTVVNTEGLDRELVRRRRRLAARYPELAGRRTTWIAQLEVDLHPVIEARISAEYPGIGERERDEATRLLAAVAVATFRSAWSWWTDRGHDASLMDDIARTFSLLDIRQLGFASTSA